MGKVVMHVLAAFAEFETGIRRERQTEGISQAKANGKYTGSKPRVSRAKVLEMHSGGSGPATIAREVGCARSTVNRILKAAA